MDQTIDTLFTLRGLFSGAPRSTAPSTAVPAMSAAGQIIGFGLGGGASYNGAGSSPVSGSAEALPVASLRHNPSATAASATKEDSSSSAAERRAGRSGQEREWLLSHRTDRLLALADSRNKRRARAQMVAIERHRTAENAAGPSLFEEETAGDADTDGANSGGCPEATVEANTDSANSGGGPEAAGLEDNTLPTLAEWQAMGLSSVSWCWYCTNQRAKAGTMEEFPEDDMNRRMKVIQEQNTRDMEQMVAWRATKDGTDLDAYEDTIEAIGNGDPSSQQL